MGVPFSNANRIRLIEAPTLSRWPSSPSGWDSPRGVPPPLYSEWDSLQGGPLLFLQVNEIHLKGLPLSTANGIRFRGVSSKAKGIRLLGVPPYPGGSLLQVNEILFKGLLLSTANGIRFKGIPFSKRVGFSSRGSPIQCK